MTRLKILVEMLQYREKDLHPERSIQTSKEIFIQFSIIITRTEILM